MKVSIAPSYTLGFYKNKLGSIILYAIFIATGAMLTFIILRENWMEILYILPLTFFSALMAALLNNVKIDEAAYRACFSIRVMTTQKYRVFGVWLIIFYVFYLVLFLIL